MSSTASRAALARGSRYARASARSAPWLHARDQEPEPLHLHFSEPLRRIRDEQHGLASFARSWRSLRSRLSLRSSIDQIYTPATRPRSRARGASAAATAKPSQDAPSSPHPSPPTRLIQPAATLG